MLPGTFLLTYGRQAFRRGRRVKDLNDEYFEGQQAVPKYSRRSGMSPPPPLCGAPTTSPLIPCMAFEQSPQKKLAIQRQCRTRAKLLRGRMVRLSLIATMDQRRVSKIYCFFDVRIMVHFARRWWFSTTNRVRLQIQNRILPGIPDFNFIFSLAWDDSQQAFFRYGLTQPCF